MAWKKRTILIRKPDKPEGCYVEHFAGKTLVAEKRVKDRYMRRLHRMILDSDSLPDSVKESAREQMAANYEYIILFADNPHILGALKRKKAAGLNEKWEGISCPLWMAAEVKR